MKRCTRCAADLPEESYAWKNKKAGTRSSECKTCHNSIRRDYYHRNGPKERAAITARKAGIKAWIRSTKAELSCSVCGEDHPATLDFHHRDQSSKVVEISKIARRKGWMPSRIETEIAKCEVLCANCHRKSHWDASAGRFNFFADGA